MPTYRPRATNGRHENGQNYLVHKGTIEKFVELVASTEPVPIIEIGPGHGALTVPLQQLGRHLSAVEIDPKTVCWLEQRLDPAVDLYEQDFLDFQLPATSHVLVGNLPFHQTTAILRHTLSAPGWTNAIFLVQWEVARRRAGIGGATMMTAQWWPWLEFALHGKIPANRFQPRPRVDGGIISISRRLQPLLDVSERKNYQRFVSNIFSGNGRGMSEILLNWAKGNSIPTRLAKFALTQQRITPHMLPKDLADSQWSGLYSLLASQL